MIENIPESLKDKLKDVDWLKSLLRNRVKPQPDMVEALRTEYEKGRADTIAVARNEQSGRWLGSISIGEEYYETDPYKDKGCAIAELKGWWDGTKIKVEQFLKRVENE